MSSSEKQVPEPRGRGPCFTIIIKELKKKHALKHRQVPMNYESYHTQARKHIVQFNHCLAFF